MAHPNQACQQYVTVLAIYWLDVRIAGKLDLGEPYRGFMHREINRNNFEMLPVCVDHAAVVSSLPFHHRDPFDRLLIAQAIVEQMPIVSSDTAFDAYSITRLW